MILSAEEYDFINRVLRELPLPLADRKQDRVRQRLRRLGLVEVAKKPRRWQATIDGIKSLTETDCSKVVKREEV